MKKIVKIEDFKNKHDYLKFLDAAMPICGMTRRIDVTKLVKKKKKHKFNTMMMFCIQNASQKNDFCHYNTNDKKTLFFYDDIATNMVIYGKDDEIYYVSIPYCETFSEYEKKYTQVYQTAYNECKNMEVADQSIIATSAIVSSSILSFQSGYTADFMTPFIVWGKYERFRFKYYLNMSFRFDHAIFVGRDVANFFNDFQEEIYNFGKKK